MSDMAHEQIPTVTLGWRLKISLGHYPAQKIADDLGVHRATVARWMGDKGAPPRAAFVKQWALITRTDARWLMTGQPSAPHPAELDEGQGSVRREGIEPPTRCVSESLELVELASVVPFPLWRTARRPARPRRVPLTLVPTTAVA